MPTIIEGAPSPPMPAEDWLPDSVSGAQQWQVEDRYNNGDNAQNMGGLALRASEYARWAAGIATEPRASSAMVYLVIQANRDAQGGSEGGQEGQEGGKPGNGSSDSPDERTTKPIRRKNGDKEH